jgi:hypothetical protein
LIRRYVAFGHLYEAFPWRRFYSAWRPTCIARIQNCSKCFRRRPKNVEGNAYPFKASR